MAPAGARITLIGEHWFSECNDTGKAFSCQRQGVFGNREGIEIELIPANSPPRDRGSPLATVDSDDGEFRVGVTVPDVHPIRYEIRGYDDGVLEAKARFLVIEVAPGS